ncbi:hypothetical protein SDJN03_01463, partial [Cucurbita argyrosperma subsp. sororia]
MHFVATVPQFCCFFWCLKVLLLWLAELKADRYTCILSHTQAICLPFHEKAFEVEIAQGSKIHDLMIVVLNCSFSMCQINTRYSVSTVQSMILGRNVG